MAKIAILDDLIGQTVTVILTDGSEITAVLKGVSHQDRWDDIILADREPLRSSAMEKIYVNTAGGQALVWPEGAEDDSAEREAARAVRSAGFSEEIYQEAVKLLDRPVTITLDEENTVVGQLEAVTPVVGDEGPTLHISSLDDAVVPIRVVQLSAVTAIELFALTHEETESFIQEEGEVAQREPAVGEASAVDTQRAQAAAAVDKTPEHSEEDVNAAFGVTDVQPEEKTPDGPSLQEEQGYGPANSGPVGSDASVADHTHGGEEHSHEDGEEPHAHSSPETPETLADPNRPTEVENDLPGEEHPEGWDPPAALLEDDGSQEDTSGSENVDDPDAD